MIIRASNAAAPNSTGGNIMNMLSGVGRAIGGWMMDQELEKRNRVPTTGQLNLTDADLGINPNNRTMTVGSGANQREAYIPTALDAVNNGIDYSAHFTGAGRTAPPPDPLAYMGQNNFAMNLGGPAGLVSGYPYLG